LVIVCAVATRNWLVIAVSAVPLLWRLSLLLALWRRERKGATTGRP
jgi:hypothetical protein